MIAYVSTQGARIIREGKHLLVKKDGDTYNTLFTYRLEQLVVMGNISITPQAFKLLMGNNIDTVFLTLSGRYLGRLALAEPKNVHLRKKQFLLSDDQEFSLRMAKSFVSGKLRNMATLLGRIKRARGHGDAKNRSREVRRIADRVDQAENLEQLRGMEGAGSARYFSSLGLGLTRDFGFRKRVRRPPTDPVNAVLSLLYTFLINRVYAAIRQAGLDPYPGCLHTLEYGRHSLALDLVEEFRPILSDSLMLSLFNLGVLKEEDFTRPTPEEEPDEGGDALEAASRDPLGRIDHMDDSGMSDLPGEQTAGPQDRVCEGNLPVRLTPEALKRVIHAFEKRLQADFFHPRAEKRLTHAQALLFQARQYRRAVEEGAGYEPLLLK